MGKKMRLVRVVFVAKIQVKRQRKTL